MIEIIKEDLLEARKIRNTQKATLLTTLLSDIQMVGKNQNRDTTDGEAIQIIKKYIENNKAFVEQVRGVNPDKVAELSNEILILEQYLPKQLTEAEIRTQIEKLASEGQYTQKEMGKLLKAFKGLYDGQYDGKIAATIAKEILGS